MNDLILSLDLATLSGTYLLCSFIIFALYVCKYFFMLTFQDNRLASRFSYEVPCFFGQTRPFFWAISPQQELLFAIVFSRYNSTIRPLSQSLTFWSWMSKTPFFITSSFRLLQQSSSSNQHFDKYRSLCGELQSSQHTLFLLKLSLLWGCSGLNHLC